MLALFNYNEYSLCTKSFESRVLKLTLFKLYTCTRIKVFIILFKYQVIRWPSSAEQQVIATRFQLNYMFPHTVGVLDGTHIRLSSCPGGDPDYINRKSFPSMQLQVFAFFENSLKNRIFKKLNV